MRQKILILIIFVCCIMLPQSSVLFASTEADVHYKSICREVMHFKESNLAEDTTTDYDPGRKDLIFKSSNHNFSDIYGTASYTSNYIEIEPNNSEIDADLVNGNYYGEPFYYIYGTITNYYYDTDFYRFDVTKSGIFDVLGIWTGDYYEYGWEDDLAIVLLDAQGNSIAFSSLIGYGTNTAQSLVVDVTPGTYYFVVLQISSYQYLYVDASYGLSLEFYPYSSTVSTPATPSGPNEGKTNETYTFSTGGSVCSNGHGIEYCFDWGDGSYSNWSPSPTASKLWTAPGNYQVKTQARCAYDNSVISLWSPEKFVSIAENIPVTGIVLSHDYYTLISGNNFIINADILPAEATNNQIKWNSSNEIVATVANGVVTAISEGTAIITATTVDGGFTDSCKITVLSDITLYNLRLFGSNRYSTAVAISQEGWPEGSNYAVLARGDVFADALAGTPLAAALDAPLLLTPSTFLHENTRDELLRLGVNYVYVLGGTGAVSEQVLSEIADAIPGCTIKRLYGSSRFQTAVAIAEEYLDVLGLDEFSNIVITSGMDFPDALVAGPYAYAHSAPILLVSKNNVPEATATALNGIDYKNAQITVIGGAGPVSDTVLVQLGAVNRIAGADRYLTGIEVAEELNGSIEGVTLYIARGDNFADALAGGTLAARNGGLVLLSGTSRVPFKLAAYLKETNPVIYMDDVSFLGGSGAISDDSIQELLAYFDFCLYR